MSLQEALDVFLAEAYSIAEDLGYEILAVGEDSDNSVDISINSSELMPDIYIYPDKISDHEWIFSAEVDFPSIEFNAEDSTGYNTYISILESWKDVAQLVNSIVLEVFDSNAVV